MKKSRTSNLMIILIPTNINNKNKENYKIKCKTNPIHNNKTHKIIIKSNTQ